MGADDLENKINSLPEDIRVIPLSSNPDPKKAFSLHPEIKSGVEHLKREWLKDLLYYVGIDEDMFEMYESEETLDAMQELKIEVFDMPRGEMTVKQAHSIIGEWAEPEIIVVPLEDGDAEAHVKLIYWSIVDFDEDE